MTQLEIDIQTIEAQIKALNDTLQIIGANTQAGQARQTTYWEYGCRSIQSNKDWKNHI